MKDIYKNFGNITNKEKLNFSFKLDGDAEVDYISASCGCTSAKYDPETRIVSGYIDGSSVGVRNEEISIDKQIKVYFDPELKATISRRDLPKDDKMYDKDSFLSIYNKAKRIITLTIAGNVRPA